MAGTQPRDINAPPRAGQSISHEGVEYTTIKEGLAYILVPHGIPTSTDPRMSKEDTQRQQVFYNPIQQFNRDLSVLAIKTFGRDAIAQKQEKHEQALKREQKKKKAKAGNESVQDALRAELQGDAPIPEPQDCAPRSELQKHSESPSKRKFDEGDDAVPEFAEGLAKRRKEEADLVNVQMTDKKAPTAFGNHGETEAHTSYQPKFTILDALSATGLRALRYAHEIPFATSITANDMSSKATDSIALNVQHNKLEGKICANTGNAIAYMYGFVGRKGFDVIDLDPYGTASPFIDAAIQAIADDGLLCVTCTDSAIFASHGYLEKTYSQYGGLPFKGEPCHEGGLRLLLHAVASSAGRYGMAIEPLLSLSIDYYIRVFVRVRKCPNDVKFLAGKTMLVYHCENGCGTWTVQHLARNKPQQNKKGATFYKYSFAKGPTADEHCEHCGFKTQISGPMYGGPLHNVGFIKRVLAELKEADRETYPTMDRMEGMLRTAMEEITFGTQGKKGAAEEEQLDPLIPKVDPAEIDRHPFFFIPSTVSKVIHCTAPPAAALRGALRHAGFRVTMSHCKPGSIKTDASWKAIWHIMLEWVRQKAPRKSPLKKGTPGEALMSKGTAHQHMTEDKDSTSTHRVTEPAGLEEVNAPLNGQNGEERATNKEKAAREGRPGYLGINFEVRFDEQLGRDHDKGKLVRYQLAPRENWGPMSRAK